MLLKLTLDSSVHNVTFQSLIDLFNLSVTFDKITKLFNLFDFTHKIIQSSTI